MGSHLQKATGCPKTSPRSRNAERKGVPATEAQEGLRKIMSSDDEVILKRIGS